MRKHHFLMLMCLMVLTSCMDRQKADVKLLKACQAGASVLLPEGSSVKEIKISAFAPSTEFGKSYREVLLIALESDGWVESEQEYKCIFAEDIGIFGAQYYATIHQLTAHGQTYGNQDGQILGAPETIINMTARVENAMRE